MVRVYHLQDITSHKYIRRCGAGGGGFVMSSNDDDNDGVGGGERAKSEGFGKCERK